MPERTMTRVGALCPSCNAVSTLFLPLDSVKKWQDGAFVQDCFPEFSSTTRETLLSGYCKKCQDEIFHEDD